MYLIIHLSDINTFKIKTMIVFFFQFTTSLILSVQNIQLTLVGVLNINLLIMFSHISEQGFFSSQTLLFFKLVHDSRLISVPLSVCLLKDGDYRDWKYFWSACLNSLNCLLIPMNSVQKAKRNSQKLLIQTSGACLCPGTALEIMLQSVLETA